MNRSQKLLSSWQLVRDEVNAYQTQLIVVSKNQSMEDIRTLYEGGQRHFGENKVQELEEKAKALESSCPEICWHMIGHLQSNKINKLKSIKNLFAVHSVDDLALLQKLYKSWGESKLFYFLQVNVAHEEEKSGLTGAELGDVLRWIAEHPHQFLKLKGLMGMGPIRVPDPLKASEAAFLELINLKKSHHLLDLELSMGMSQDYPLALSQGTQWVRVGSKIFTVP